MIKKNVSLSGYCTYGTGGNAEFFCEPKTVSHIKEIFDFIKADKMPLTIIGHGANILVSDDGVKGLTVALRRLNNFIIRKGNCVYAGGGVNLDSLIEYSVENGLGGLEAMSGIPGSVGGAVSMNAGAFGTEIKDKAFTIECLNFNGEQICVNACDAGFGYRKAENLNCVIVTGCTFKLESCDTQELRKIRNDILAKRDEKQPLNYPSCGSVFKRPEGNFAGTLIEQSGLKGFIIGGAQVSEKHANFIINIGGAKSSDIYELINKIKTTVFNQSGIMLEPEVKFLGF